MIVFNLVFSLMSSVVAQDKECITSGRPKKEEPELPSGIV
jgi:hypothetical protein